MEINPNDILPSGARLLIAPDEKATETEGGIILGGDEKNSAPVKGTILATGPLSKFLVGTVVLFRRYSIDELKIQTSVGEQVVYFLDDQDILGSIKVDLPDNIIKYPKIAEKKELDQIKNADEKKPSVLEEDLEASSLQESSSKENGS